MILGLLWIIGVYALGAVAVHAAYRRFAQSDGADVKHYVLYTLNDSRHIEWAVRSISWFYWLRGRQVLITVIDEGSTDETLLIVNSLERTHLIHVQEQNTTLLPNQAPSSKTATNNECTVQQTFSTFHPQHKPQRNAQHRPQLNSHLKHPFNQQDDPSVITSEGNYSNLFEQPQPNFDLIHIRLRRPEDMQKLPLSLFA